MKFDFESAHTSLKKHVLPSEKGVFDSSFETFKKVMESQEFLDNLSSVTTFGILTGGLIVLEGATTSGDPISLTLHPENQVTLTEQV